MNIIGFITHARVQPNGAKLDSVNVGDRQGKADKIVCGRDESGSVRAPDTHSKLTLSCNVESNLFKRT